MALARDAVSLAASSACWFCSAPLAATVSRRTLRSELSGTLLAGDGTRSLSLGEAARVPGERLPGLSAASVELALRLIRSANDLARWSAVRNRSSSSLRGSSGSTGL